MDVVLPMGVLEHLALAERLSFYEVCERILSPTSSCILDIRVEVGPTILVKERTRTILKDRTPEYSLKVLAKTAVAWKVSGAKRFDPLNDATFIHYHTDFDYRLLHAELAQRFNVGDPVPTPFPRSPSWLGNQELFSVARPKNHDAAPPPPT